MTVFDKLMNNDINLTSKSMLGEEDLMQAGKNEDNQGTNINLEQIDSDIPKIELPQVMHVHAEQIVEDIESAIELSNSPQEDTLLKQ